MSELFDRVYGDHFRELEVKMRAEYEDWANEKVEQIAHKKAQQMAQQIAQQMAQQAVEKELENIVTGLLRQYQTTEPELPIHVICQ